MYIIKDSNLLLVGSLFYSVKYLICFLVPTPVIKNSLSLIFDTTFFVYERSYVFASISGFSVSSQRKCTGTTLLKLLLICFYIWSE